jgi:hypothetical protein
MNVWFVILIFGHNALVAGPTNDIGCQAVAKEYAVRADLAYGRLNPVDPALKLGDRYVARNDIVFDCVASEIQPELYDYGERGR